MLCPPPRSCLCFVSQSASLFFSLGCCVRLPGLVFVLSPSLLACSSAWDAVSSSLVLSLFCLPVCQLVLQPGMLCPAPWSCLRSCLPVSQLVLQTGVLCPAPWSCLGLVSGLVSQSASLFFSLDDVSGSPGLVSLPACSSAWDAVSGSLVLSLSCLRVCQLVLQPGMLCPAPWSCLCFVSQSASLFFSLGCCVRLPGLIFVLSPVLSPNLSPSLPACSSAWDAVSGPLVLSLCCLRSCPKLPPSLPACSSAWDAVSGSLVLSLSCLRSCLPSCLPVCQLVLQPGVLSPAPWSCLCLVSGLVFVLSPSLPACSSAWDAVSGSMVLSLFCLPVC